MTSQVPCVRSSARVDVKDGGTAMRFVASLSWPVGPWLQPLCWSLHLLGRRGATPVESAPKRWVDGRSANASRTSLPANPLQPLPSPREGYKSIKSQSLLLPRTSALRCLSNNTEEGF